MASGSQDLDGFVREALTRGLPRDQVAAALVSAGWPEVQVRSALDAYADVGFPIPVPRPRTTLSARDAFFYLLLFTTLYIAAFHFGSLAFDLINRALPDAADPAWRADHLGEAIRFSTASILIAFPVFLYLSWWLGREDLRNPTRRLSPVRRWLTYLTLFVAASVLVCDMIALVDALLGGELTLRFVLKVAVVAVIAGTAFGYYLGDLRRGEAEA
jgi:hypothetical protein